MEYVYYEWSFGCVWKDLESNIIWRRWEVILGSTFMVVNEEMEGVVGKVGRYRGSWDS